MDLGMLLGGGGQDRFAKSLIKRLQARGWPNEIKYDADAFQAELGGATGTLHLRRIQEQWLGQPIWARASWLDRFADLLREGESQSAYEDVSARILPVVNTRIHFANMDLDALGQPGHAAPQGMVRLIGQHLAVLIRAEHSQGVQLANDRLLDHWGKPVAEILKTARDNLRREGVDSLKAAPGGFRLALGEDTCASMLLFPALFKDIGLQGLPVAVVVSSRILAVAGSEDVAALNGMAAFVESFAEDKGGDVGYAPVVLSGDEWLPFEPVGEAFKAVRVLAAKQRLWDYALQTPLLQAAYERRGEDLFVAPLEGRFDGGELWTWSSWAGGLSPLLPRSDFISLIRDPDHTLLRRWEDVEAVCGAFEEVGAFYPPRFRARAERWPSGPAWDRLKTEFEAPRWSPG